MSQQGTPTSDQIVPGPLGPFERGRPRPTRLVTRATVITAAVAASAGVAQLINTQFFDLRNKRLDWDTHASFAGALSLLALLAAIFGSFPSGRNERSPEPYVLGIVLSVVLALRIAQPPHVTVIAVPIVAGALVLLLREAGRRGGREATIIRTGCAVLAASFVIRIVELQLGMSSLDPASVSYQMESLLKHETELVGWTLVAVGLSSGIGFGRAGFRETGTALAGEYSHSHELLINRTSEP